MKLRLGFVSNSSGSSFLLYGAEIEMEKFAKLLANKEGKQYDEDEERSEMMEKIYAHDKLPDGLALEIPGWDYPEHVYIGISWDEVGGEEIGNQFKARVKEAIEKYFGRKVKCDTHEAHWSQ